MSTQAPYCLQCNSMHCHHVQQSQNGFEQYQNYIKEQMNQQIQSLGTKQILSSSGLGRFDPPPDLKKPDKKKLLLLLR